MNVNRIATEDLKEIANQIRASQIIQENLLKKLE